MNRDQAKAVLQLYQPGISADSDTQMTEALALVGQDPELHQWLEEHIRFQRAIRQSLRAMTPPPGLKQKILTRSKTIRLGSWWKTPLSFPLAASLVALVGLCFGVVELWKTSRAHDRFADYQHRVVRSVLREYHMDTVTDDLDQVRHLFAVRGAPANFPIPSRLAHLRLTGGGILRWRSHPVAMVCYNRGDEQMLFLFVMDRSAVKDPPPYLPAVAKVSELLTASWTAGDKTYVLAGLGEAGFLQKYLE